MHIRLRRLALTAGLLAALAVATPATASPIDPSVDSRRLVAQAQIIPLGQTPETGLFCGRYVVGFATNFVTMRTITFYFNGEEFFSDTGEVVPEQADVVSYGPLEKGKWRITVRLGDDTHIGMTLADLPFVVDCP